MDNATKKIAHAQEHMATNGNVVGTTDALFLALFLKPLRRLEVAQSRRELIHQTFFVDTALTLWNQHTRERILFWQSHSDIIMYEGLSKSS